MFQVKPATTFEQQVQILRSRGLIIHDEQKAIEVLKRINYYRLSAYTLSLRLKKDEDFIRPGITFEHVVRLYQFDKELRNLFMSILENVEIAFRTHIAYLIAHKYGPLGYQDPNNFASEKWYKESHEELMECINRSKSKELFIKHHIEHYNGQFPVWVAFEVLTFSMVSKWFKNLKKEDKIQISREYYHGIPYKRIESWLQTLSYVRNVCAHHGRIYNKTLVFNPNLPTKAEDMGIDNKKIFSVVYVLCNLVKDKDEIKSWLTKLEALIEEYYDEIDLSLIGFIDNWFNILINVVEQS